MAALAVVEPAVCGGAKVANTGDSRERVVFAARREGAGFCDQCVKALPAMG